jgi:hypothetical protein
VAESAFHVRLSADCFLIRPDCFKIGFQLQVKAPLNTRLTFFDGTLPTSALRQLKHALLAR